MLKIALGQMDILPGRPDVNAEKMLEMIKCAGEQQAGLIIFPELAIPGYLLGDAWEQQSFLRECEEFGERIIAASKDISIIFGNIAIDWEKRGNDGRPRKYNACFVAHEGRLVRPPGFEYPFFIKTLQPNYRQFDDARHFYSLPQLAVDLGKSIKDLLTTVNITLAGRSFAIGCAICEDCWNDDYTIDPVGIFKSNGKPDIFVNIASSPFTLGKNNKRNRIFKEHAKKLNTSFIYVNNVGLQNNGKTVYAFDGSSAVYDRDGRIIHCCPSFAEELAVFYLDQNDSQAIEPIDDNNIADVHRAIGYALPKFLKSTGLERIVIGASGGIDSAVSAALYAKAVDPQNLLLVNMPSKFNSARTRNLAEELARNLNCLYTVMPIDAAVDNTISQIGRTPVDNLSRGSRFNLEVTPFMAENIQARDRSSRLLAGIAAAFGGAFTCNSNKSELTIGYSTLYGDQAGFLAVIADLWKHQVYDLAKYLNQFVYERQVIPEDVMNIVPSAELSFEQNIEKGQGDPLIYPYHDYLFRSFIEHWRRASPEDILEWYLEGALEEKIGCQPGLVSRVFKTGAEFIADLEKWWNLHTGLAVAKRIQAPPILAISRRAYGFDYRESQNGPYYTQKYFRLKEKILAKSEK